MIPDTEYVGNYYFYEDFQGEGITVYIEDTGVFTEHPEFEGRAIKGPNFSTDMRNEDLVGHGTHVAGIVGSRTFGVAKKAKIVSVKVLDSTGQGTLSSVIAGLEYAVKHRKTNGDNPSVINLSLGAPKSAVLDHAITAAVDSGIFVVVAAGNANIDACTTSPAGSSYAYTVGAIDAKRDRIAGFSNWGECIDMFAVGVNVESLSHKKRDLSEVQVLSGTSMASPAIAGLSAVLLGKGVDVTDLGEELNRLAVHGAIPNRVINRKIGSPNVIASNGLRYDELFISRFRGHTENERIWKDKANVTYKNSTLTNKR